ncbi:MAG: hypothetical protein K0S47_1773 [Herbinix sp.]|jgi:predicted MPP superfamily phosphohydrolase|nr:hypothetical protein [Herbinix sp.]
MGFLISIIVIITISIVISKIEQQFLTTTNYMIGSKKLPQDFDGKSFVLLSDLHNKCIGKYNQKLIKAIEKEAPDYILIAGDMISKEMDCIPSSAYSLIEQLSRNYPIYYGYGNHEQKMITDEDKYHWHEYKEKLIRVGVIFLDNETKSISNGQSSLLITGISIDREFYKRSDVPKLKSSYLKDLVPPQDPMKYHILIAHNPVYFKEYITWGADLVVAGHLHGGLVRLPMIGGLISPQVKVLPKYDSGKYRDLDSEMIVSRGLGTHSYMLRLFNRPELIKITMKSITS